MRLLLLVLASGCATTSATSNPRDPWEGYNRPVYDFNDALDRAVLKPVAQGYVKVLPEFARTGVNNFFGNLERLRHRPQQLPAGQARRKAPPTSDASW